MSCSMGMRTKSGHIGRMVSYALDLKIPLSLKALTVICPLAARKLKFNNAGGAEVSSRGYSRRFKVAPLSPLNLT